MCERPPFAVFSLRIALHVLQIDLVRMANLVHLLDCLISKTSANLRSGNCVQSL
jgi:hypothetical protein